MREYVGEAAAAEFAKGAHDALVDTRATVQVFLGQLGKVPDLPRTVSELHRAYFETAGSDRVDPAGAFYWRYRKATFAFGKHVGLSLEQVAKLDDGYLRWIAGSDFDESVKTIVREARQGRFPEPKEEEHAR